MASVRLVGALAAAIVVATVPEAALADFCSILKRGQAAQVAECHKAATANGVAIIGNWSIMSTNGRDPKSGKRGAYRTASTPPADGRWERLGNDHVLYLNASCFLGQRTFALAEGVSVASTTTDNVWLTLDDKPRMVETWPVAGGDLRVPPNSALVSGLASARRVTLELPQYSYTKKVVSTNLLIFETAGYPQAAKNLCH